MTLSKLAILALPIMAVGVLAADCSSTNLTNPKHDSGTDVPVVSKRDSGPDAPTDAAHDAPVTPPHDSGADQAIGPGGCSGHAPGPSEVPFFHRATAQACAAGDATPDAGSSCSSDADCVPDGGTGLTLLRTCLHGRCRSDECLVDSDCGNTGLCACARFASPTGSGGSGGAGGSNAPVAGGQSGAAGAGAFARNICLPGNCRVDSDCGTNGYCVASFGPCGGIDGYYCHTANDSCMNASEDCPPASCGGRPLCTYSPAAAAFTCKTQTCAG